MMIIAFILVGVLVYYTFNTNSSNHNHSTNSNARNNPSNFSPINNANHPIDILNERFAKGEIDEAEYLKKKAILNQ